MKALFVVSNLRSLWRGDQENLFVLEPYVHHMLMKDGEIRRFNNVLVADGRRQNRPALEADCRFVDEKYAEYVSVFSDRLNHIHGCSFDEAYWKKVLFMGFFRYITYVHDAFVKYEEYFDQNAHVCNIISPDDYLIPRTFENQRDVLQFSDFGQEQLFSVYSNLFYIGLHPQVRIKNSLGDVENVRVGLLKRLSNLARKVCKKNLWHEILIRVMGALPLGNVRVGIIGAHFSRGNLSKLLCRGSGKIGQVNGFSIASPCHLKIDWSLREEISEFPVNADRFDQFFFTATKYLFPSAFLEDYQFLINEIDQVFEPYKSLKYLISEAWMGDTFYSMALARMRQKGIRHIYNEHNTIFYPWVGYMTERRAALSDIFYTTGWFADGVPNIVKGSSLFDFGETVFGKKKYKACLISNVRFVKMAEYSGVCGICAENVPGFVSFMRAFYGKLSMETKAKILYRGPRAGTQKFLTYCYDNEYLLDPYLAQLISADTANMSGKDVMRISGLVIVDYISTTHLESMHMNIPTIVLFNPTIHFLKPEYENFFGELIEAGIFQTDPAEAAVFVESVIENPLEWWSLSKTQTAKINFLERNFGPPKDAIDFYLSLAESREWGS